MVYATRDTLFFQNGLQLPDLYIVSIYPTLVGGLRKVFVEVNLADAGDVLSTLRDVQLLADWIKLRDRCGVLRNSVCLWPFYVVEP